MLKITEMHSDVMSRFHNAYYLVNSEEEEATEGAWREELDLSVAKNGDSEKDDVVLVEREKGLFLKV
ncbi:unnamed protein product [Sphagnum troendelagicum]|uniref:Uncharacterized protein n=1 Tax=Sphagnum troendelagicum TaxID=128251 RepID=A0ABP0TY10_9BRYO